MYFSAPGPAGPCRFSGCVSFSERETRILGSSKQVINKDFFSDGISIIMERFKSCLRQTASVNLYHVTNFSLFLSLTVHTSTEKMCSFTPALFVSEDDYRTVQVVETSVTVNNNSPIQDYIHPDHQTQPSLYCLVF